MLTEFFIFYIQLYIFALLEFVNSVVTTKKQEKLEISSLEGNRWGIFLLQFVITIRLLGTIKHKVQRKRRIHLYLSSLSRGHLWTHCPFFGCLAEAITILWAAKGNHLASLTRSAKSLPLIIPLKLPLARLLW